MIRIFNYILILEYFLLKKKVYQLQNEKYVVPLEKIRLTLILRQS